MCVRASWVYIVLYFTRPYILMLKILKWLVEKKIESEKYTREYAELAVCVCACVCVCQCAISLFDDVGLFTMSNGCVRGVFHLPSLIYSLSFALSLFLLALFLISSIYMWCVSRSLSFILFWMCFFYAWCCFFPYFPKFERNHHFIFPFDGGGSSTNQHNANTEMNWKWFWGPSHTYKHMFTHDSARMRTHQCRI